jgi:NADH-quinone oxidoreductase subunit C
LTPEDAAAALQAQFGDAIQDMVRFRGEVSLVIAPNRIVEVSWYCHDELTFTFLSDLTATDYLDRSPRFDVIYHLTSIEHMIRLRLKVQTDLDVPVDTVSEVWGAANWAEREVYDLFGIEFANHPDLRRILMPEGWVGHPLRKDFRQTQIALPRPKTDKWVE